MFVIITVKKRKLYFLSFIILFSLAAFIPKVSTKAADNSAKIIKDNKDFKVSARYGFGGSVMYDIPMQVMITIESKQNFEGTLRVYKDVDSAQTVVAFGRRITLAAGETKTYKLTANAPNQTGIVHLAIFNEKDKVVYEESSTLTMDSKDPNSMVGILSDDYSGIAYFNGVSIASSGYMGNVSTFELSREDFPENSQALGSLKFLIIDNFDTSSLSSKQFDALKKWVSDGGILILGLGSHYQRVLSGFKDDFVSGNLGSLSTKSIKWSSMIGEENITNVDCMDFELNGGQPFMPDGFTDITAFKDYGLGNVAILSFSLSMEPVTNYERRYELASAILTDIAIHNNHYYDARYGWQFDAGTNLTSIGENSKTPSAILYGLLLSVYVILVGPVLYIILKKKNIREKIWIAIPIVSVAFTGIIYLTSFLYRINKPILNTFSIINISEEQAYENVYAELICPNIKRYDMKISDKYSDFQCKNEYDYGFFGNNNSVEKGQFDYMILDNGTDYSMVFNSNELFDRYTFGFGRIVPEGFGKITYDIDCTTTGFSGTITNDTAFDLKDVVLNFENHFYMAGDIKKGETVAIDPSKIIDSQGYGVFDGLYNNYNNSNYTNKIGYQQYQIDSSIETNLIDINRFNTGYVWGTIESYKTELMSDKDVKSSGTAVIINGFRQEYSDVSGSYYPSIANFAVDTQGDMDGNSGYLYGMTAEVTYSFEGAGDIDTLRAEKDTAVDGVYADVYAFNMDTGEYDIIFADNDTLSGKELNKYLSHGILKLKYERNQSTVNYDYADCLLPKISAGGK